MNAETEWVVANLGKLARREARAGGKVLTAPRPLRPWEQMQRFLNGDEFARVVSGEVSPKDFVTYQEAMLKELGIRR